MQYTRRMRTLLLLLTFSAVSMCRAQDRPAQALLDADKAFDRDTAARGLEGWMSWFAEDAQIPGQTGMIQGRAALREVYTKMFAAREFSIHWWPVQAELSTDGSLGYTFGRAKISWRDDKGELQTKDSRYTTVWRRQKDGSYKVIFDMGG